MADEGFCRERSLGEPIAGTAKQVVRWILVEDPLPWGRKIPKDSSLQPATRRWLGARDDEPHTRVQLIRRSGSAHLGGRTHERTHAVFLIEATAEPEGRRFVELELTEAQIPKLDVDALLEAAPPCSELAAIVLVCTHGVRDPCCAKWGMPIYDVLRARAPARVWQCSHLGGHRFAPTFLTLPSGLVWARTAVDEAPVILDALDAGELARIDRLRGRSAYASPVQVAEIELRRREGVYADAALRLREHEVLADGGHRVSFARPGGVEDELLDELWIGARALPEPTPSNCGDPPEPRTVYRLRTCGTSR